MTPPSLHDAEQLSAYLDSQLSGSERARLEARLKADPELAGLLADLRQTRALLRQTPRRRAPRNFSLTPRMAGLRPPTPRLVPVFSWASAAAAVLFLFTLGSSLLGSVGMNAAPQLASAPLTKNSAASDNTRSAYGIGGGPAATAAPVAATESPAATLLPAPTQALLTNEQTTPTPEISALSAPAPESTNAPAALPPHVASAPHPTLTILWPSVWLGLAVVLLLTALTVRWSSLRTFRRKHKSG